MFSTLVSIPEGRLGKLRISNSHQHVATDSDGLNQLGDPHGRLGDGIGSEIILNLLSTFQSAEYTNAVHDNCIHQGGHGLRELCFDVIKILHTEGHS